MNHAVFQMLEGIDLNNIKTALITAPLPHSILYGDWDLSDVDGISPPIGLLFLAAMIKKYNGVVTIHDAYAHRLSLDETITDALNKKPDVIGITCMTPSYPQTKKLIQGLKNVAPEIPIILGGAHISALREKVMEDIIELDYGVINEGEITIIELLNEIKTKNDLSKIDGILYRLGDKVLKTKDRQFISFMDALPLPAWEILPSLTDPYRLTIIGTKGDKSTSLLTSRGCPARCTFCDTGAVGNKVRAFSAEYVINMLEHLIVNYGINDFLFYDDTFVGLKTRTRQICEEIIKRNWKINWSCCARVDLVDLDILKLMKKAGCWQIEYGIESGSQKILDIMRKRIKLEQVERALKWTKQADIETRWNFIFGFIGETKETLEETIRFALKIELDYFQQSFLTPYPGSEIYNDIEKYGEFDKDLEKMNNMTINFIPKDLTKEDLKYYSSKAFKSFYLRPKIILYQLMKNIKNLKRLRKAFIAFLKTIF